MTSTMVNPSSADRPAVRLTFLPVGAYEGRLSGSDEFLGAQGVELRRHHRNGMMSGCRA
jgi:hypothetical protein